jgi:ADP-heptose:LPS heptosyltransferase
MKMKMEMNNNMRKFYINVQGGTGLNIALASFISSVKDAHPGEYEFYVCSPYFDVFESCPSVDGVYKPNELKDLIFDAEANGGELILHRLYDMDGFIKKQLNYSEAWAKLMNIEWEDTENGTTAKSLLNPSKKYPYLVQQIEQIKNAFKQRGFKDYIIVQFTGGQSPLVQVPPKVVKNEQGMETQVPDWGRVPYNYDNEPLKRHYPIEKAQEFVDAFAAAHPETAILLFQLPNEPMPKNNSTFNFVVPYLAYYELAKDAVGTVSIDSSLQHLVAGVTKSVVIWAHSKPKSFGYSYNKNIEQPCRTDDLLYFSALGPSGAKVNYISPNELLKEVDKHLYNKD